MNTRPVESPRLSEEVNPMCPVCRNSNSVVRTAPDNKEIVEPRGTAIRRPRAVEHRSLWECQRCGSHIG